MPGREWENGDTIPPGGRRQEMKAEAAIGTGATWQEALDKVREKLEADGGEPAADLALLFASDSYGEGLKELVREVRRTTGAKTLLGCSSQGVISTGREIENEPGISLQLFSLPGATLTPARLSAEDLRAPQIARIWSEHLGHLK